MLKWRKRIPVLILLISIFAVGAMAFNSMTTKAELDKAAHVEQLKQISSTTAGKTIDPAVAAKRAEQAAIAAKLAADEQRGDKKGEEPYRPQKIEPQVTKNREFGVATIQGHPKTVVNPRTIYLSEDFEDTLNFPPVGWDTINTDPGYGWFPGVYQGGGTRAALVTWHGPGFIQDEWLITPQIDVSSATSNLRLEFWFLKGYTYPHLFKVYVSTDGTTFNEIWDSDTTGYPTFEWWKYTIDMSAYAGGAPIWIGFQYYGEDADLFGLDDILLTDDEAPVGRCCYGDPGAPDCQDVTEAECDALGGNWSAGLNCTDDPCPVAGPNDNCADVTPQLLPYTFTGNNEAATFDTYCQWFGDYPNVWIAFTITECSNVTIDYCGSPANWGNGWLNLITSCGCEDGTLISDATYDFDCANGNPHIYFAGLEPGDYWYPIMYDPANGAAGDYVITVTAEPCPPAPENDDCASAQEIGDVTDYAFSTADATPDGSGYTTGPNIWYCYTATCDGIATVSLCGSSYDTKLAAYDGCTCDPLGTMLDSNDDDCSLQSTVNFPVVAGNQYLIEVGGFGTAAGDGILNISCAPAGPSEPGDNCDNPIKVDIPALPFDDLGQTTCGHGDDYDATCLGSYDGGEDIIYEVTVLSPVTVNIELDPQGTSWTGILLSTDCPPTNCIDYSTSSGSSPHGMTCVSLDPGVYYLMVDTWPSPDCIPSFDLHIRDTTCAALENDDCADAIEVGNVVDLAFSTETATFDGGGTCQSAPNIWYCYTATEDGIATISLCGSDYDTKLAVYDGCTCGPLGPELACNDDACSVQSEVEIPVVAGNSYLIEIGGYGSSTGSGILNISVSAPCDVECPPGATPEGEPCIADDTDDNTNGGCNSDPPVFGSISCGETVCGTFNTYLYGGSNYRDTDWYLLSLSDWTDVTLTASGEFPIVVGFVEPQTLGNADCGQLTGNLNPYATGDNCDTVTVTHLGLPPGDYIVFVSGTEYTGFDCSTAPHEYWISVDCSPATPTYCSASGGCDEYIDNVTVGEINNTSACDGYADFTSMCATMEAGGSYPITINISGGYSSDTGAVWVDWNQDYDFDDPGEMQPLTVGHGVGPYTGTITVPIDAVPGNTRMRIRLTWNTEPTPCGAHSYGEVEDYCITVGEAAPSYLVDPDPMLVLYKFSIDPLNGAIYISNAALASGDVNDMTNVALSVAGCSVPVGTTEIIPGGWGDLVGDVLKVPFPVKDYIECEEDHQGGIIWDQVDSFFDITYEISGTPGTVSGQVTIMGHISGDVNLDGQVNVADLTMLVSYIFSGGEAPQVIEVADVDASGGLPNVADITYLVAYLFNGGPAPTHQ